MVSFDGAVASAFSLVRNGGKQVSFSATASVVAGRTVVTLDNFTGGSTQFGSLADGRYTLTALFPFITDSFQQFLDGDDDGQPGGNYVFGEAQGLYHLFGDINGDRRVDISDFGFFSLAYLNPLNYNAALDLLLSPSQRATFAAHWGQAFFDTEFPRRQALIDDVTLEIECNWKTSVDAFNEAYHVAATHPQTLEFTDDVNVPLDCYERHTRMIFRDPNGHRCEHKTPLGVLVCRDQRGRRMASRKSCGAEE
jgi:hypothetical protein